MEIRNISGLSKMRAPIIKMHVNVTSKKCVADKISNWVIDQQSRYICVSNVHMCMEVFDDRGYATAVNGSDLTVPDGKPIFWAQRALGNKYAQQVRGEDLMLVVCKKAENLGFSVGFFGATEELLDKLKVKLLEKFPKLDIAFIYAPPFRAITDDEDKQYVEAINNSDIGVLFVGLGCPKQEIWMSSHKGRVNCIMLGVGAAFDFIAGTKKKAPSWVQKTGLEWLFRLISEPRRLWRRYLKHNPRFIWYFGLQLLGRKY